MSEYSVEYYIHISLVAFINKFFKVFCSSEVRFYRKIVISIVACGCKFFVIQLVCTCVEYRSKPQSIHSQIFYVVECIDNTANISVVFAWTVSLIESESISALECFYHYLVDSQFIKFSGKLLVG